jgi:hypothetical protein
MRHGPGSERASTADALECLQPAWSQTDSRLDRRLGDRGRCVYDRSRNSGTCGEMKIGTDDDALTGQLLAFLRDHGCIAYYESANDAIEAIAPHLFGKDEADMIRILVERWQSERPDVTIEIEA